MSDLQSLRCFIYLFIECLQGVYAPSGVETKGDGVNFDLMLRYPVQMNRFHNLGRILDLNYNGRLIIHFAFDVSGSIKLENFKKSIEFAKAIVKKVSLFPSFN